MSTDKVANTRISALERKVTALVRTGVKIQLQTSEALEKLNKAVNSLRKALPHVNFED